MNTYTMIAQYVFEVQLSSSARAVYDALRSFSDSKYKDVDASYQRIASRVGLSRRTAIRAAAELVAAGLIYIRRRRGFWNTFIFHKFQHSKSEEGVTNLHWGGDKNDTSTGDKNDTSTGDKSAPIPESLNPESTPDNASIQLLDSLNNYLKASMSPLQNNKQETLKLLAHLQQLHPNLHPAHFPAFIQWYLRHVTGKNGEAYKLPTKINTIARHLSKFWGSGDRRNIDHEVTINPNADYSGGEVLLTGSAEQPIIPPHVWTEEEVAEIIRKNPMLKRSQFIRDEE